MDMSLLLEYVVPCILDSIYTIVFKINASYYMYVQSYTCTYIIRRMVSIVLRVLVIFHDMLLGHVHQT